MRTRITNDGSRKAGTSVKLTTFAALEEEDEVMRPKDPADEEAKRAIDLGNLREQAERMKGMNWADIADEEELDGSHRSGDWNEASKDDANSGDAREKEDDEEEDEPTVEVVLDIKPEKPTQAKSKKSPGGKGKDNFDDLIADLTKLNASTGDKKITNDDQQLDAQSVEEREKAKAQLRAKIAASATSRKKTAKEEETRKKTKSEKKEARKQFER